MAVSYNPQIVTDGLVLYLDAANSKCFVAGSTLANNIIFFGNNGTLFSGASYTINPGTSGYFTGAHQSSVFTFDGVCGYIEIPNHPSFANTSTLTIDFWIGSRYNNGVWLTSRPLLGTMGQATDSNGFQVKTGLSKTNNPISIDIRNGSASTLSFEGTAQGYTDFNLSGNSRYSWDNIIIRTRSTGTRIYADMKINGQATRPEENVLKTGFTSSNPLRIARGITGSGLGGSSTYYGGENKGIAMLKIYNRQLSEEEMLQNYYATRGRFFD